jgi:hypothetical protein
MEVAIHLIELSVPNNLQTVATLLLGILVGSLYNAAVIYFMASIVTNNPWSVIHCYRAALLVWLKLALLYLITTIATLAGLIAFVIPGIIAFIRFAFADFICILEDRTALDAMNESWQRTQRYQWEIMVGYALLLLLFEGPIYIFYQFTSQPIAESVLHIVSNIVTFIGAVYLFRIYTLLKSTVID